MRLVHLPLEEWDCLLLAAFSFCIVVMSVVCKHLSGSPPPTQCPSPATRVFSGFPPCFHHHLPHQPLLLPSPPLGKGLPITHPPPAHFMHKRVMSFLVKMTIFWEWEEVPQTELCSALKKRAAGSRVSPPPHGRVKGIGEDLTSSREGNLSPLLFLLQEQGWLPALPIGKISFSLPLASSPRWVQSGGGPREQPLSPGSLHQGVGRPGRAGGTPSSSLFPYAHFSCLLCLVSWMPGLPGAKWDTGDFHVTPVPLRTSPRLELEAAGRICQPMGHSTNQLELACPHHPFQLPHKVRASFACIIILPACTFFA